MRRREPFQVTSRMMLKILAIGSICGSAAYWWGVQSVLTSSIPVAIAYTAIMVLAPLVMLSFVIPTTPAGMLLQRINGRTIGLSVVTFCATYFMYYSWQVIGSWWGAQPVAAEADLVNQQTIIALIGFIIIPALLIAPVTSDELTEQLKQAHLVQRYEIQTKAEITLLRTSLFRAQKLSMRGLANLTDSERDELYFTVRAMVAGMDRTLKEINDTIHVVGGVRLDQELLQDDESIHNTLEYFGDQLFAYDEPEKKQLPNDRDLVQSLLARENEKKQPRRK